MVLTRQARETPGTIELPVTVLEDHNKEALDEFEIVRNTAVLDAVMEDENSTFTSDDIKNIKLPSTTWKSGYLEDGCLNFLALKKKNKVWQFKNCFQLILKNAFSHNIKSRVDRCWREH